MANGDYGPVVSQLALACESYNNNYEKEPVDVISCMNSGQKTPTLEMKTLAMAQEPLLKDDKADQIDSDGMDSIDDGRSCYRVPSEWSKFCTLVGRCRVHYFRDWVSVLCNST